MTVSLVQLGPRTAFAGATVSPTLAAGSTAGTTLVVAASAFGTTPPAIGAPAGWVRVAQGYTASGVVGCRDEIWLWNPAGDGVTGGNAGGITAPGAWTCTGATAMRATVFEITGAGTIWFDSGGGWASSAVATVMPGAFCPSQAGFGILAMSAAFSSAPSGAWTIGGWTAGRSNATTGASEDHIYNPSIAAGYQAFTGGYTITTNGTGDAIALASFTDVQPAATAVYDAGNATGPGGASTTLAVPLASTAGINITGPLRLPAIGDLIWVLAGYSSTSAISTVTDSKGQTYALQGSTSLSGSQQIAVFTLINTQALTAADSITITYGAAAGGKAAIVRGCPQVTSATWANANSGFGTSTAPGSGATGALTLPRLVIAAIMNAAAGGSPTALSFSTANSQVQIGGGAYLTELDDPGPPSGGRTASATIVSTGWGAIIGTVPLLPPVLPAWQLRRLVRPSAESSRVTAYR